MVKSGKLSKYEAFYIEQNPDNLSVEELAAQLDRSVKVVSKHYKTNEPEQVEEPPTAAKEESPIFKLVGRHKRNGKNVATVMTKAASEFADNTRPSRVGGSNKIKSAIHKPRG